VHHFRVVGPGKSPNRSRHPAGLGKATATSCPEEVVVLETRPAGSGPTGVGSACAAATIANAIPITNVIRPSAIVRGRCVVPS
jgi:hypothetical protein